MLRGLVHESPGGYSVTSQYTTGQPQGQTPHATAANSAATGSVDVTTSTTSTAEPSLGADVNSALDSFFASHAFTRDDVLVATAVMQVVLWLVVIYLQVSDR